MIVSVLVLLVMLVIGLMLVLIGAIRADKAEISGLEIGVKRWKERRDYWHNKYLDVIDEISELKTNLAELKSKLAELEAMAVEESDRTWDRIEVAMQLLSGELDGELPGLQKVIDTRNAEVAAMMKEAFDELDDNLTSDSDSESEPAK